MLNITYRKQFHSVVHRYFIVLSKLSYSDSSMLKVKTPLKIKEYGHDYDQKEIKKEKFEKHFIEDLFINKFQKNILEYPELKHLKQVQAVERQCYLAQKLLGSSDNKLEILCKSDFGNPMTVIRTNELTGFKLPRHKRGFGYVNSEFSLMQETLALNPSLSKSIYENDNFGAYLISMFGSDSQKEKYLKKLGGAEVVVSLAHLESEQLALLDPDLINAKAVISEDKLSYRISGEKKWVYNANHADVFIVSANTTVVNSDGVKETKPTLFLVPKDVQGLTIHKPISNFALKSLSISNISLNNVVVPASSVLGSVQTGGQIINDILSKGKLNNGEHCLPIMRELVTAAVKHCIQADFFKKPKYEKLYFKSIISNMVTTVYALESMTYLLIGRLDHFINPDVFLESLIVKIYASENLRSIIQTCIEIIGQDTIKSDINWKQIIQDAQFFAASDITNDHLRLILGMTGVQYALKYRESKSYFARKVLDAKRYKLHYIPHDRENTCVYTEELSWYLHKMFKTDSVLLEDCVSWLYECTHDLIKSHGEDALNQHWELKALADMAIYIYAQTAALGRASRAYCIGVKRSEVDRCVTAALTSIHHFKVTAIGKLLRNPDRHPTLDKIDEKIMQSTNYSQMFSILNNMKVRN